MNDRRTLTLNCATCMTTGLPPDECDCAWHGAARAQVGNQGRNDTYDPDDVLPLPTMNEGLEPYDIVTNVSADDCLSPPTLNDGLEPFDAVAEYRKRRDQFEKGGY